MDKILTLISNVSKFKDPGQKPFRYSSRQSYTLSDDIDMILWKYWWKAQS